MEVFWRLPINRIPPPSPANLTNGNGNVTHPRLPQTDPSKFCGTRTSGRSCPTITECDPEWRKTKQTANILRQVIFAQNFAFLPHILRLVEDKSFGCNFFCTNFDADGKSFAFFLLTFRSTFHEASYDIWDRTTHMIESKARGTTRWKLTRRWKLVSWDIKAKIRCSAHFLPASMFCEMFFILPSDASTKIPPQRRQSHNDHIVNSSDSF